MGPWKRPDCFPKITQKNMADRHKTMFESSVMVYVYNASIQEVEEGGPQVLGQPGLNSETLLKSKTNRI